MGQTLAGPVTVERVDELQQASGDIRLKKILVDLITDIKSGKISVPELEAVLIHNNLANINGGGNYHLSEEQFILINNNGGKRFGQQNFSSASTIQLDASNQSFKLLDGTTPIELLEIEGTGDVDFKAGELFCIIIPDGATIVHKAARTQTAVPFNLILQQDFTNNSGRDVALVFEAHSGQGGFIFEFIETGAATIALETERSSYTSVKKQAATDSVDSDTFIYGFDSSDLTGCTVSCNNGNLGVQITDDRIEFTEAGNAYEVIVKDSLGVDKYIIPLSEGNELIDVRQEIIIGKKLRIANLAGASTTQDVYFSNHEYGSDELERTSDNELYYIPYDTTKTSNYEE